MATKLSFRDFLDLLLLRIYELEQTEGDRFFNLNLVAQQIKDQIPRNWPFDAAKVLETRGWAQCIYTFGSTSARLTGEGRLHVEESGGIIAEARQTPVNFFNITIHGNQNQIAAGQNQNGVTQTLTLEQEREPVLRLVEEAKAALNKDTSVSPDRREEAAASLDMLRLQLRKPEPDRSLVAAILEPLSKITSIANSVASLIRIFNAS